MKFHLAFVLLFATSAFAQPDKPNPHPKLFLEKGTLVYSDDFDGAFNKDQWEIRQQTRWATQDGILVGKESPLAFQEEMKAKNDSHTGEGPIIRLNKIPRDFICHMRLKYEGADYVKGRPLFDVGHHKNSFLFSAENTRLNLDTGKKMITRPVQLLPINTWVDVTIEFTDGKMVIQMNTQTQTYQNPLITMEGHSEFTFKAIPKGRLLFDYVKLWKAASKN